MKKLAFITTTVLLITSCNNTKTNNIELGESYGPHKVDTSLAVSVSEMMTCYNKKEEKFEFTFKSKISEICTKAGCWVNIDKGNGETFMVRFKNHFTIPSKTKLGTEAYIHGFAYYDSIAVEQLQHFANDAGKSKEEIAKITQPKYEMGFEADGIVLVK